MPRPEARFLVATLAGLSVVSCRVGGANELFDALPTSSTQSAGGGWVKAKGTCTSAFRPSAYGHVVYTSLTDKHVHRVEARPGAFAEDVTFELDRITGGSDTFINAAPGGEWLVVGTSRFGCGQDDCMLVVSPDVCSAQVIVDASGDIVHPDGNSAIGVDAHGDVVVVYPYPGPHQRDLFAVRKHGDAWGDPILITGGSPYQYAQYPAISDDGTKALYDCGDDSEAGGPGTSLCEVAVDGRSFRVARAPAQGPAGVAPYPLHSGDYEPNGGLVFEGEWNKGGEQIWHAAPGAAPVLVAAATDVDGNYKYSDDNSPCALPDGRIVSLWLERPGAGGHHELKVMNPDGGGGAMLVVGLDVLDIGIGCGK